MTRPVVPVLVVCLLAATGLWSKPVAPAKSGAKAKAVATKSKSYAAKTSAKRVPASGRTPSTLSKAKYSAAKYSAPKRYAPPASPSSDRIKDIQQALLDRGYLSSSPDGVWSAQCVEALKRFESDRKLKIDGKIDSRILIALGLGPKYDENLALPIPGSAGIVAADDNKIDFQRFN